MSKTVRVRRRADLAMSSLVVAWCIPGDKRAVKAASYEKSVLPVMAFVFAAGDKAVCWISLGATIGSSVVVCSGEFTPRCTGRRIAIPLAASQLHDVRER